MTKHVSALVILCGFLVILTSCAGMRMSIDPHIDEFAGVGIIEFDSGLLMVYGKGFYSNAEVIESTNVIPYKNIIERKNITFKEKFRDFGRESKYAFGWCMSYETWKSIKMYQKLYFPGDPSNYWKEYGDIEVKDNIITSKVRALRIGVQKWNWSWTLEPGDPLGKYILEIYLEDQLFKTLTFYIIDEDGAKKSYKEGLEFYENGDYENAKKRFDYTISNMTNLGSAYNMRGNCYYYLDELDKALKDWEISCEHDSEIGCDNFNNFSK